MKKVQKLLGFHQVNTSAYHPQTDDLMECFNRTLIAMLAKTVQTDGHDWDESCPMFCLPTGLVATSLHKSPPFTYCMEGTPNSLLLLPGLPTRQGQPSISRNIALSCILGCLRHGRTMLELRSGRKLPTTAGVD